MSIHTYSEVSGLHTELVAQMYSRAKNQILDHAAIRDGIIACVQKLATVLDGIEREFATNLLGKLDENGFKNTLDGVHGRMREKREEEERNKLADQQDLLIAQALQVLLRETSNDVKRYIATLLLDPNIVSVDANITMPEISVTPKRDVKTTRIGKARKKSDLNPKDDGTIAPTQQIATLKSQLQPLNIFSLEHGM